MNAKSETIVIAGGARTAIGHISRALSGLKPEDLMVDAIQATLSRAKLSKNKVDGVLVGWVGQSFSAPNIARVAALRADLPLSVQAVTVQNNCVSSIESIASACRFIMAGEGEVYLAGGVEVMSRIPYSIDGSRASKALRSLTVVKDKWAELLASPDVAVVDAMEQGLTDPVKNINMAVTAEICAQIYGVTRAEQDEYARESFRRTLAGWKSGFFAASVVPVARDGVTVLEKDEYPFLREDLVDKPQMFAKAPAAFDNSHYSMKQFYADNAAHLEGKTYQEGAKGTVSLFNSCGRSDGAAAVIVTTAKKAKELGLEILAEIKGWGFEGNNPAHMGVSPALAAPTALKRAGVKFEDLDQIELHEPFAATVLSIFKLGKSQYGHDWEAKYKSGAMNPNGGSLAVGHPLGATGARLMLNLVHALKNNPKTKAAGMLAACAGGGMGGAMVVEKTS